MEDGLVLKTAMLSKDDETVLILIVVEDGLVLNIVMTLGDSVQS